MLSNVFIVIFFLEFIAVIFGFLSVWFAKENNVLVYPAGILSTAIFVYLLIISELYGDATINGYYFLMSFYGWYFWTQKKSGQIINQVGRTSLNEKIGSIFLFLFGIIAIFLIYNYFNKWSTVSAYIDTLTTGIFFVAMWLMSRRKIEHWTFWIVGDVLSVPLYIYKGLFLTAIQYFVFTIIAIIGYREWKKIIQKNQEIV
ncbi:MAG: nicotinamide mononucleotide transporter [Flavobacteriaceae bacterium]|nr:nicotinamide mononucleotide transporter [Flavobacteriaceae bacterium]